MFRVLCLTILLCMGTNLIAEEPSNGNSDDSTLHEVYGLGINPTLTGSPRQTLETFFRLRGDLETSLSEYNFERSVQNYTRVLFLSDQLISLIDTAEIPVAKRYKTGSETAYYLLDILGRVPEVDLKTVPDVDAIDGEASGRFRIPETPINLTVVTEGSRAGEYLFNAETNLVAPRFFAGIQSYPLRTSLPIASWTAMSKNISGPLVPISTLATVPKVLTKSILGTPLWKILLVFLVVAATVLILLLWHHVLTQRVPQNQRSGPRFRILSPVAIMLASIYLKSALGYQINVSGTFFDISVFLIVVVFYGAAVWAFWLSSRAFFDTVILDPTFPDYSLDASMIRLVGQILGLAGGIVIIGVGANELGVPVLSMIAGLGIGGIAIALAVRPTLENLIAGFVLYLDRPVRVGDFCTFEGQDGTIEAIGVRSTTIRGTDRTLITIPNAQFADMHLINWAQCDEMLIQETLGLHFQTEPDQLRFILAKTREMFYAHPKISSSTVRVRLSKVGPTEFGITVRVFAKTNQWDEFHAIREDVFFRIADIITESGSSFSYPSQVVYSSQDVTAHDETLKNKAMATVDTWRNQRRFPFPDFPSAVIQRLTGTINYPLPASPDSWEADLPAKNEEFSKSSSPDRLSGRSTSFDEDDGT